MTRAATNKYQSGKSASPPRGRSCDQIESTSTNERLLQNDRAKSADTSLQTENGRKYHPHQPLKRKNRGKVKKKTNKNGGNSDNASLCSTESERYSPSIDEETQSDVDDFRRNHNKHKSKKHKK